MFKKFKDKIAEEVKSSPQRIQQFAQAAQAAVTSASSSISDITNNDLFSINDTESNNSRQTRGPNSPNNDLKTFQDVSLGQNTANPDFNSASDIIENQRQRRLSNSSFASDVSFRLPSYETPSMYHLQSDMEVSASEAEERGFSTGNVSLERVTKEQLYAAYKKTQERYVKYRTQYGDLARHYKLLEKENAKARSVLVETQDKALRRISELREQCSLEQSAKAHLEKALRIELEEKSMKIDALNTKIQLLQDTSLNNKAESSVIDNNQNQAENVQLINLSNDSETKSLVEDNSAAEITTLNIKIEKMEQLLNKYKDSLKVSKDKNVQTANELQILSREIETKDKEISDLKLTVEDLNECKKKIQQLENVNEELQNTINAYDFAKSKEFSSLEIDLQKAKEEIEELQSKVAGFSKKEEEYAISLAENKLRIHKELENKESEIKSLKDSLTTSTAQIESLNKAIENYKTNLENLKEEQLSQKNIHEDLHISKTKISELELLVQDLNKKSSHLEQLNMKADENYKCLQLQQKQETAEKLAMIDRNAYLESRNMQLTEENTKKSSKISMLENELLVSKRDNSNENFESIIKEKNDLIDELNSWKSQYEKLESEMKEERVELGKLQSEIEKLLANHELIQSQNTEYRSAVTKINVEKTTLQEQLHKHKETISAFKKLAAEINEIQQFVQSTSDMVVALKKETSNALSSCNKQLIDSVSALINKEVKNMMVKQEELIATNITLENQLAKFNEQQKTMLATISNIQQENDTMKMINENLTTENDTLNEKVSMLSNQYNKAIQDHELLKNEKECLATKLSESENVFKSYTEENNKQRNDVEVVEQKLKALESEKINLLKTIESTQNNNLLLNSQLEETKADFKTQCEDLQNVNNILKGKLDAKEDESSVKLLEINQLENKIKTLTDENISLQGQARVIAGRYQKLESEVNNLRDSHTSLEGERDRLNTVIDTIETKYKTVNTEKGTIETQTENLLESEQNDNNDYTILKNSQDDLKEENRRLQSDIEGLQTYLTKISKENSVLNDKLRELIATSEHVSDSMPENDLKELKSELELEREKIENLLRENTLLIEENLELKDQLQAQNYTKSENGVSASQIKDSRDSFENKDKYNSLLQNYSKIEQKLLDSEQINKSVSTNLQLMQDKNEKLRSSNEKLERRLDEALVSLRHLHSLQENTELEYLRNILYEYLTGSGTHSVTLAKVLAAIVKFDDHQTQLVLQKEKERQSFLRQLGII